MTCVAVIDGRSAPLKKLALACAMYGAAQGVLRLASSAYLAYVHATPERHMRFDASAWAAWVLFYRMYIEPDAPRAELIFGANVALVALSIALVVASVHLAASVVSNARETSRRGRASGDIAHVYALWSLVVLANCVADAVMTCAAVRDVALVYGAVHSGVEKVNDNLYETLEEALFGVTDDFGGHSNEDDGPWSSHLVIPERGPNSSRAASRNQHARWEWPWTPPERRKGEEVRGATMALLLLASRFVVLWLANVACAAVLLVAPCGLVIGPSRCPMSR